MRFIFLSFISVYRLVISPLLPVACRFTPTCSHYATEAIKMHGALRGGLLALSRIVRCHPYGKSGFDPVPCSCKLEDAHE
jgi:putative membrane protein insertion efficiency factor